MLSVRTDCRSPQVCRYRTQKGQCRHHSGTEQPHLTVNPNVTLVASSTILLAKGAPTPLACCTLTHGMVQANSFGRFHLHNGVISSHNRLHRPFYSSQRMPIYKVSMEEARCGAVFPVVVRPKVRAFLSPRVSHLAQGSHTLRIIRKW